MGGRYLGGESISKIDTKQTIVKPWTIWRGTSQQFINIGQIEEGEEVRVLVVLGTLKEGQAVRSYQGTNWEAGQVR
jgi:hypothetical protein